MTVQVQETVFRYVANGVSTSFAYGCLILSAADLVVTVDGVVVTTGFTITGIGAPTGGTVDFTVAPVNLKSVILQRIVKLERTTDYQQHGDWLAAVVNPDFDRLWMAEQQQAEQISRSIKLPISVTGVSAQLPIPIGGQVIAWKPDGSGLQNVGPVDNTLLAVQLAASSGSSLVGWIQSGAGAVAQTVQAKLRQIKSASDYSSFAAYAAVAETGFFYSGNGSVIHRLADRVFVGGAVQNDGAYPNVNQDWLSVFQNTLNVSPSIVSAQFAALTPSSTSNIGGGPAIVGGGQTRYGSVGANAYGLIGYGINNCLAAGFAWGLYLEGHRTNDVTNSVWGTEIQVRQMGALRTQNPYAADFGLAVGAQIGAGCGVGGATVTGSIAGTTLTVTSLGKVLGAYQLAVGSMVYGLGVTAGTTITALGTGTGGIGTYTLNNALSLGARSFVLSHQFPASSAITIAPNPLSFNSGIIFQAGSVGPDAASNTEAITFYQGNRLQWYTSPGTKTSYVQCSGTTAANSMGIIFNELGICTVNSAGGISAIFTPGTAAIGANNWLTMTGSALGVAPSLKADGSDANVNLFLGTKGTGVLQFGTYTASPLAVTGYISILDAAGNGRRLLVG